MEFTYLTSPDAEASALLTEYFDERIEIWQGEGHYRPSPADFSRGALVVAHLDGEPVALGGIRPIDEPGLVTFEVKHMYTRPEARGKGVGRRLLEELEQQARARGATDVVLDTNSSLDVAASLYRAAGYLETEPFNDNANADRWYRKRFA